ncbi:MAG: metal ABC transporter ATP-binding protein [Bacilli bacterium]|jgi:zinc transport system ATP-binding protein|nr:metal ABC transporter ATP-binding protein [Bacilli bacterium]
MRVTVNNLTFAYTQKLVLNKISFSLKSGDFLTIHGKNGTGKSTLIKCFLKLLSVPDGSIYLDDVDINHLKVFKNIGYVPQKTEFNYEFPITVFEILSCAYNKKRDAFYTSIINALDLNKIYHENINNLSGGQIQRVFIARSLLNNPKLLILDEPTVGVDAENVKALHQILADLKKQEITIIISSHDLDFCKDLTDYSLVLNDLGDYRFQKMGEEYDS